MKFMATRKKCPFKSKSFIFTMTNKMFFLILQVTDLMKRERAVAHYLFTKELKNDK